MPKMHVKKGDTVVVIAGKDKGATGKIIAAYPREQKVLVEGVNLVKKHTKIGQSARGAKTGGIITQEAPIHASNVMLYCPKCNGPARVRMQIIEKKDPRGKRRREALRMCKRCGEAIGGAR